MTYKPIDGLVEWQSRQWERLNSERERFRTFVQATHGDCRSCGTQLFVTMHGSVQSDGKARCGACTRKL